jgi:hypothetical protein
MDSYVNDMECSWPELTTLRCYVPKEQSETIIILNENGNMIMQFEMYVTLMVTLR